MRNGPGMVKTYWKDAWGRKGRPGPGRDAGNPIGVTSSHLVSSDWAGRSSALRGTVEPAGGDSVSSSNLVHRREGLRRRMTEVAPCHSDPPEHMEASSSVGGSRRPAKNQMRAQHLSQEELLRLTRVVGKMAPVKVTERKVQLNDITNRVAELDEELQAKIQGICDRLSQPPRRRSICGSVARLSRQILPLQFLRFGVIKDILPEIVFYTVYTFLVTFYAHSQDWVQLWSAVNQDTIYYVGLVFAFLLGFRASDCMLRYSLGLKYVTEMEKHLRGLAFEVLTNLVVDTSMISHLGRRSSHVADDCVVPNSLKIRYFKHELMRMLQLLFACAARDLNDSAVSEEDFSSEELGRLMSMSVTQVEHAAIHVTHSIHGHVFRVYIVAGWLRNMVIEVHNQMLFDRPQVIRRFDHHLSQFKESWVQARQIAYSQMPSRVTHLLWVLTNALNLTLVIEYVAVCQWLTIFPSLCITISCFGVLKVAEEMENPFGFDSDDIPIWDLARHLDEEISLIAYYAQLDEVGNENLYRHAMNLERISLGRDSAERGGSSRRA